MAPPRNSKQSRKGRLHSENQSLKEVKHQNSARTKKMKLKSRQRLPGASFAVVSEDVDSAVENKSLTDSVKHSDETGSSEFEDSEEDDDIDPEKQEIINVDFEFFDPKPDDFHGLKGLLNSYLDDRSWNVSELVDTILSQTTIGTVVKTSEDETPIGLITCLNLERYKDLQCIKDILNVVRSRAGEVATSLDAMIGKSARGVGLIISERLINIPFALAGPLHTALFDEIKWGLEDEPTVELKNFCKYKHYIIMTRVYLEKQKKKKGEAAQETKVLANGLPDYIFIRPEDEVFLKLSVHHFTFPVNSASQATHQSHGLKQLRLVMILNAKKVPVFRSSLQRLIDEGQ